MHAGDIIVDHLLAEEIDTIFTVSGGLLLPIFDGCLERGIRVVHARDEAAAAYMAQGWAKSTRKPGVVAVTCGAAVSNTTSGALTSFTGGIPLLIIGARAGNNIIYKDGEQELDGTTIMRNVTKYCATVTHIDRLSELLSNAMRYIMSGRKGPAFLDITADVLTATSEKPILYKLGYRPCYTKSVDYSSISKMVSYIAASESPIIIAGSGAYWSGASSELRAIAEKMEVPIFTDKHARGCIPEDHPLYCGVARPSLNPAASFAEKNADLVLLAGARCDWTVDYGNSFSENAKIIQIDIEPTEIGHNRQVHLGIVGDLKTTLHEFLGQQLKSFPEWTSRIQKIRSNFLNQYNILANRYKEQSPVHPLSLLKTISDLLPKDAIVVSGGGDTEFNVRSLVPIFEPGHYLRAENGYLGADLPYAIGAKLANIKKPVVLITGDGGFGYGALEFDTADIHNTPIVCVIFNDKAWGMIRKPQEVTYGSDRTIGTELKWRNYERICETLGGKGYSPKTVSDFTDIFKKALLDEKSTCINVPTSYFPSGETMVDFNVAEIPEGEFWTAEYDTGIE